jgi:hypothetical protein
MPQVLRTRFTILNEFAARLKQIGRRDLHDMLGGEQVMEGVKKVADAVGFRKYPVEGEPMVDYINELWEFINKSE